MEAYVLTKDDAEFLKQALTTLRNTSVNPIQQPSNPAPFLVQSYDQATSTYLVLTPPGGIGKALPGTAPNSLATPTYAQCQVIQQNNVVQPPQLFLVPGFTVQVWNYDLSQDILGSRILPVMQNSYGEWVPCTANPGASGAYIALTPPAGIPAGFYPDDMGTGTGTGSGTGTGTGCEGHAEHFTAGQAVCSIFRIIDAARGNLRPVGTSETVYNLSTSAIAGCSLVLIVEDAYGSWIAVCSCSSEHITTGGPTPTLTISGGVTTGTIVGTDSAGLITVTNPSTISSGLVGTVTFASPYPYPPIINLTTVGTGTSGLYTITAYNVTATGFQLYATLVAGSPLTTLSVNYLSVGVPPPPPPKVTSLSPGSGSTAGGTSVTVTGSNFATATQVYFGVTPATGFTVTSDTTIVATSPAESAGTVDVTVTTPEGTSPAGVGSQFTYVSSGPGTTCGMAGSTSLGTPNASSGGSGAFQNWWVIPSVPAGTYNFTGTEASGLDPAFTGQINSGVCGSQLTVASFNLDGSSNAFAWPGGDLYVNLFRVGGFSPWNYTFTIS